MIEAAKTLQANIIRGLSVIGLEIEERFKNFEVVVQTPDLGWNKHMFMKLDLSWLGSKDPWSSCKRHCYFHQDCTMMRLSGTVCYLGHYFKIQDPPKIADDGNSGQIIRLVTF